MKKIVKIALVLLGFLSVSSCTQRLVDFTIISTKNVDLSRASTFKRTTHRATGEDAKYIIVIIPTGVPSAKEAVDQAIESVSGGVALVDGVLTNSWFYIPYIFGENKFIVEGSVLIDPVLAKQSASISPQSSHSIVVCDKKGLVVSKRSVSKDEYYKMKLDFGLLAKNP